MLLIEQTTVAATALPIAEFKDHLRLGTGFSDDDVQDSILETCIRSAVAAIEGRTGKALIERQFLQSVTCWRTSDWHAIPIAPVSSIVSVSVLDRAGAPTLIDPGQYGLIKDFALPRLAATTVLPNIPSGGSAEIVFQAGFGPAWSDMPDDLIQAVFILAAEFYESRTGGVKNPGGLPKAVDALIDRYRPVRLLGGGAHGTGA